MTEDDTVTQRNVLARALDHGINWIDTAATYSDGRSETSIGRALAELDAVDEFHLATKVRLTPDQLAQHSIGDLVRESVEGSLRRLRVDRITLLQLHNSVTRSRGDLPTSVTSDDALGAGGIVEVQGTAEGDPFSRAQFDALLSLAADGIEKLVAAQRSALGI